MRLPWNRPPKRWTYLAAYSATRVSGHSCIGRAVLDLPSPIQCFDDVVAAEKGVVRHVPDDPTQALVSCYITSLTLLKVGRPNE